MSIERLEAQLIGIEKEIHKIKLDIEVAGVHKSAVEICVGKLETSIDSVQLMFHDLRELILLHEQSVSNLEDDHDKTRITTNENQKILNRMLGALTIIIPAITVIAFVWKTFGNNI